MPRTYRSALRDEHAADTRERILTAAHRLLGRVRPVDLAFADVAAEAGVSVRTLYRHFPTSDALFLALSDRLLGAIIGPDKRVPHDIPAAMAVLRRQFHMLEQDPALFRVFFAVPTRSRHRSDSAAKAMFAPYLADVPEAQHHVIYGLLDLMWSPYSWDVLHANWGADGESAYRAVLAGIRAVLELAERDPAAFGTGDPPPPPKQTRRRK